MSFGFKGLIITVYLHINYWLVITYKIDDVCFNEIKSMLTGYEPFIHDLWFGNSTRWLIFGSVIVTAVPSTTEQVYRLSQY
jgi:hypothetical protein